MSLASLAPEIAVLGQLLVGIGGSAIVGAVTASKKRRTREQQQELQDIEDAAWRGKTFAELVDSEVMKAAGYRGEDKGFLEGWTGSKPPAGTSKTPSNPSGKSY